MPTNDERREVAAMLRYAGSDCLDGGGLLPTLKRVLGVEGSWRDVFDRLADLIEPEERTCHDDYDGRQFRCSECGSLIHLLKRDDTFDWEFLHPDFCPFCGAKVVE